MENKPKIIASTVDEFNSISERLKKLPESILSQIETVVDHRLLGLECQIRKKYDQTGTYLPKSTRQITTFDDYIGVYCDDFFFKLPKENKIDYVILDK